MSDTVHDDASRSGVLITGATGFIGARLAHLLACGPGAGPVRCLVRRRPQPGRLPDGASLHEGDLLRPETLPGAVRGASIIYHLAKLVPAEREVDATGNLLRAVREAGTARRFVLVSSATVSQRFRTDVRGPKEIQEEMVRRECDAASVEHTILRACMVYGPGCSENIAASLARAARERRWYTRYDWPGRWTLIYVDDLARLIRDASRSPAAAGATWVAGADPAIRLGDTLAEMHRALGTGAALRPAPGALVATTARLLPILVRLRLVRRRASWLASTLVSDRWVVPAGEAWTALGTGPETDVAAGMRRWLAGG